MKRRAVVVMAIGNRYQSILVKRLRELEAYAQRCVAELVIISENIDKSPEPRSPIDQKLLIPHLLKHFELIAFIDLDILISEDAPCIFDEVSQASFYAVINENGKQYANTCERFFGIDPSPSQDYFTKRGRVPSSCHMPINGGVWMCKPHVVADYLYEAYWELRDSFTLKGVCYDELNFAYMTQARGDFSGLDKRYNRQVLYYLYGSDEFYENIARSKAFRVIRRVETMYPNLKVPYPREYSNLIRHLLRNNWFVHFAGKLPYLNYK
jgi:hypothetical protein